MAVLNGGAAQNTLTGTDQDDQIYGYRNHDELYGLEGDDELYGGAGNDYLEGGIGADVLDGGLGIDTASYRTSSDRVSVSLSSNSAALGDAAGDTLIDIENLHGSDFDDILSGNGYANELRGFDGDDFIYGYGGSDTIYGDNGNDTIDLQSTANPSLSPITTSAWGGDGDDTFIAKFSSSYDFTISLYGDSGNDVFQLANPSGTGSSGFLPKNHVLNVETGFGNDTVYLHMQNDANLTLSRGSEHILFAHYNCIFDFNSLSVRSDINGISDYGVTTIMNFNPNEDVLHFEDILAEYSDWDGAENPFDEGYALLSQVGSDVHVLLSDQRKLANLSAVFIIEDMTVNALTPAAFGGINHQSSQMFGMIADFSEDAAENRVRGTFRDDVILTGHGNDWIVDNLGGNDEIITGAGDDHVILIRETEGIASNAEVHLGSGADKFDLHQLVDTFSTTEINAGSGDPAYLMIVMDQAAQSFAGSSVSIFAEDLNYMNVSLVHNSRVAIDLLNVNIVAIDFEAEGNISTIYNLSGTPELITIRNFSNEGANTIKLGDLEDHLTTNWGGANPFDVSAGFLKLYQNGANAEHHLT